MKTLKKTLCLVLALVMVVGTLAVAASADVAQPVDNFANYKDGAAAKASPYAEAIDVNLGLGIINGVSKTELKLDGTLTRAQAAKIAAYIKNGEKIAEKLSPASSFSDVKANSWASKYIAWASSDDVAILNGVGGGKFNPGGDLTGYQFLKILLNSLGYGLEKKNRLDMQTGELLEYVVNSYTGSNWKTKVSLDAATIGLGDGLDSSVDLDNALTRAEAMELVYEAIKLAPAGKIQYKLGSKDTDTDAYGRSVVVKTNAKDGNKVISAAYPEKPFYTYEAAAATTQKAIIEAYNKDNKAEIVGAAATAVEAGTVIEFYLKNDNKTIDHVVEYNYQFAVVTEMNTDGTIKTTKGAALAGLKIEGAAKDAKLVVPFSVTLGKFVEADAKVVTEADVTGKAGAYAKDESNVTIGGTKYSQDKNYTDALGIKGIKGTDGMNKDFANDFALYLSPVGTILAIQKVTEAATEPDYLYGFAVAYQVQKGAAAGADSTDLIGNVSKGSEAVPAVVVVQVITPAGENKVINLKLDAKSEKLTNKTFFAGKTQAVSGVDPATGEIKDNSNGKKSVVLSAPEFIKYYMDGDKAVITADDALTTLGSAYTKANVKFDGMTLNSATELYIVTEKKDKDDKVTGYTAESKTGYKNFPAFDATKTKYAVVEKDSKIVGVYVWGAATESVADTIHVPAYIVEIGDQTAKGFQVKAIVDGKEVTYNAKAVDTFTEKKFYKDVTANDDGVVESATLWTGTPYTVKSVDAGYFVASDDTLFQYPENVKVIDLTGKGLTAVAEKQTVMVFATTNDETVKTDGTNKTIVIFITAVAE